MHRIDLAQFITLPTIFVNAKTFFFRHILSSKNQGVAYLWILSAGVYSTLI